MSALPLDADERPKRKGWAPGKYINKCFWCAVRFWGDKRARECADCAYSEPHPSYTSRT